MSARRNTSTACPKCGSADINNDDGHYLCWACHHEWDDPPHPKLSGRERIVRILEDGWLAYQADAASPKATIRIDGREDEEINVGLLRDMVRDGALTASAREIDDYRDGKKRTRTVLAYDLARGPESEVTLRFKSKAEKDYFVSQLLDGWGENVVRAKWEGAAHEAAAFDVVITDDFRPERRKSY